MFLGINTCRKQRKTGEDKMSMSLVVALALVHG